MHAYSIRVASGGNPASRCAGRRHHPNPAATSGRRLQISTQAAACCGRGILVAAAAGPLIRPPRARCALPSSASPSSWPLNFYGMDNRLPGLLLLLLLGLGAVPVAAATRRPRHAVILLVDDLGYGDVGHMGAEYPTPAIDELALGGIRLNQSYSMQLCSPTRAGRCALALTPAQCARSILRQSPALVRPWPCGPCSPALVPVPVQCRHGR